MDLNKYINSLYSHEIISNLIKNEVTIYGKFLRKILFDNCSIDDYFKDDNNKINGYTRLVFRDIIERDLDKYLKKINNHPNLHFIIGDIANTTIINQTIIRYKFEIIILDPILI